MPASSSQVTRSLALLTTGILLGFLTFSLLQSQTERSKRAQLVTIPFYCCKNGNTPAAVCNTGITGTDGQLDGCDGIGAYATRESCNIVCGITVTSNSSSTSGGSSAGSDTAPWCCNPADAAHSQAYCTPAA